MNKYIALDLETTGFYPKQDRIIEIGALKVEDGEIVDEFSTLVNPRMEIPERIVQLTGITTVQARKGLLTEEAIPRLVDFCEDYPILGHCVMFDYSFIKHKAFNMGLTFERDGIDTLVIARKKLAKLESRRLCSLCDYYKIERAQEHRATDDARSAHLLYQKLYADFGGDSPEVFLAKPLVYKVKKQGIITNKQKDYLNDLLKYHRMEIDVEVDSLTKSEASRLIDKIILENGKIMR